ncbi:hypothetical protein PQX77_006366 [Marasmius sp. AFHP31]|nr:hypothetical protein PQX77_006366 [Marasmius sp. AFHP31]
MGHFQRNCNGECMDELTTTLDLHHPAEEIPHKSLEFEQESDECLFALRARACPKVLESVRCLENQCHPVVVVLVGKHYKTRQLDVSKVIPKKFQCPVWLFTWANEVSRCMDSAAQVWLHIQEDYEEHKAEDDEVCKGRDGLTEWERKVVEEKGAKQKMDQTEGDSLNALSESPERRKKARTM